MNHMTIATCSSRTESGWLTGDSAGTGALAIPTACSEGKEGSGICTEPLLCARHGTNTAPRQPPLVCAVADLATRKF